MDADQAYAACDPLNLDFAPVNPDQDRIDAVNRKLAWAEKTMATPRYAFYFNRHGAALKIMLDEQIKWAREHIARDGQSDEGGDYALDRAEFFAGNIVEVIEIAVDKVDDAASDLDYY